MMEKAKLRRADFITSLILILFSIWELSQTFTMPMKDSYAGVKSSWYVSPALMPLIIGTGLMLLSIVLLIHSIRSGGAADFLKRIKSREIDPELREGGESMILIVVALGSFVYLTIPRVDFLLAILNFLFFFMVIFYFDDRQFKRSFGLAYTVGAALFALVSFSGLYDVLQGIFKYSVDILFLFIFIAQLVYGRLRAKELGILKKYRVSWIVSLATPLVLVPVFRYLLLVQLPYEGGIVKLFNLVYYALR